MRIGGELGALQFRTRTGWTCPGGLLKNKSNYTGAAVWVLVMAVFAACTSVQPPDPTPFLGPAGDTVMPLVKTPTHSISPTAILLPTVISPTSTPVPGSALVTSPVPTFTPDFPVIFRIVRMMDVHKGWAIVDLGAEDRSHVLRTGDGGATWRDVSPSSDGPFESFFLDEQVAWLWHGDSAWRTQDGGLTWASLGDLGWLPGIWFNDSQHGWKLNAELWGLSFRQFDITSFSTTQDGGQSWHDAPPPSDQGVILYMAYPDAQTAWAISAGFAKTIEGVPNLVIPFSIQTTFDGGNTWTSRQLPFPPGTARVERPYEGVYLGDVGNCEFISPVYSSTAIWKLALTCESQSWMYTTANQGSTWIINPMPSGIDVRIQFIDPSTGWLFLGGSLHDYQGDLYQTTDGGQSWTLIKRTGWGDVQLSFVDAQTGWAIACSDGYCSEQNTEKALLMTSNGGVTWQSLHHASRLDSSYSFVPGDWMP
jgi:photosystem II stability/assembly factor-like uncharacterized protein